MRRISGCLAVLLIAALLAPAADLAPPPRAVVPPKPPTPRMPLTGLAPAKPMFNACVYHYGVGTGSPECQAFLNQALGMYYSYVWIEAARAAETAVTHDPECAYAWLILHRSLEKWGRGNATPKNPALAGALGVASYATLPARFTSSPLDASLETARKLMPKASHREQLLIQARLQEKGMWPNVKADERRKKAQETLDELLMLHDDDQEAWFWRAQLAESGNAKAVYYKALLRVNPVHPGANHELVHYFENVRRPALGWPFAEAYMRSSPGIPHSFHMQAHLGMRIGKWSQTTNWSWKAIELQIAYHKHQEVQPREDHQFNHHMETLTRSLIHDGRFDEAKEIKGKAEEHKYAFRPEWFRMALTEKDWDACEKLIALFRRSDKSAGAYYAALLALEKGETEQAGREVDTLRQTRESRKTDKTLERRLWEAQGRYLCQRGDGEAGVKLLKKIVDATKNDFGHHAWGNGAVYMESWGVGALEAGIAADAEEAFQEALAHDAGSVRGALGLWALCDRLGRAEEAGRYLKVAQRVWAKAATRDFESIKSDMARRATKVRIATLAAEDEHSGK